MSRTNVASRGVVRVNRRRCDTCIFGPASPVGTDRREEMAAAATEADGVIPCHHTLEHDEQAVCHGFYSLRSTATLRLAELMDVIEWAEPERWT